MSVQLNSSLCSVCGSTPQCQSQTNSFSRHSSAEQEPPWHRAGLDGGSSRRQWHARGCSACCLPSGNDGVSRQTFPARHSMNEAEGALWDWLPEMDPSHMARAPRLWLHSSLLSQKLQQEASCSTLQFVPSVGDSRHFPGMEACPFHHLASLRSTRHGMKMSPWAMGNIPLDAQQLGTLPRDQDKAELPKHPDHSKQVGCALWSAAHPSLWG